ncbi:MAG: outer membrane protein assembly factor BamD [Planctomycetota bacterium]|jgi:outer membrane assembly lipoprotein YfiO
MIRLRVASLFLAAVSGLFLLSTVSADVVWTPKEGWLKTDALEGPGSREFESAFRFYMRGRYAKAAGRFKRAAKRAGEPLKEDARILQAESLLAANDYRAAFKAYKAFLEEYPNSRHSDRAFEGQLMIARALLAGAKIKFAGLRIWTAYGLGVKAVDEIISARPLSEYARQAQITLARSYHRRGLYIESASAYRQYVELFPDGAEVSEALLGAAESVLADAQGPGYDPLPYYKAKAMAEDLVRQYPTAPEAPRGLSIIRSSRRALAEHDYKAARWYLKAGRIDAARLCLETIVNSYGGTEWAGRASIMLEALSAAGGNNGS